MIRPHSFRRLATRVIVMLLGGASWAGRGSSWRRRYRAMRALLGLTVLVALGGLLVTRVTAWSTGGPVATGTGHSCAVASGGAVLCWGNNQGGKLGNGATTDSLTPVAVSGLASGVVAVAASAWHSCALTSGGAVLCWGRGGLLGDGTATTRLTPVPVSGLTSGVVAVAAGWDHTCAVTSGGAVLCWGSNNSGQLGDGTVYARLAPVPVSGLPGMVAAVAAGQSHTCALTSGGAVLCWGNNDYGQLGDGTRTDRLAPVPVSGLPDGVAAIAAGWAHTCALTNSGAVLCWGANTAGQLGNGASCPAGSGCQFQPTPAVVSGLSSGVVAVAAGYLYTCAVTSGGAVRCWGDNGWLQPDWLVPTAVSGLDSGVVAVSAGYNHRCAMTNRGAVKCWGGNDVGQLGDGTTTNSLYAAVTVVGLTGSYPPTVSAIWPAEGPVGGGSTVTITGGNFVAGQTSVTIGGRAATGVVVNGATQLTAVIPTGTVGGATVAVTTPGGTASVPNSFTYFGGANRRYFAEGAIIPGFFEVSIALLNPDPAADAHVWLRFLREGATEVGQGVVVPALGRRTVLVNDLPVMGTPAYTAFSTVVESDVPVVADRTMVWDSRVYGAHAETSIASPAPTWYLAEGATHSGFELYYLIQNPNPTAATVQVTYLRPSPLAPVVRQYVVAASSRKTIYVNGEGPELAATDVSAKIESLDPALPIIVERAMYLTDGWGHQFGAGHESAGVTAPSTRWFLAEGATVSAFGSTGSFFDMYILIANPNAGAATVTMTYLLPDGTTVTKTLQVAGNSRQTVYVNGADARLADTPVSTVVTSTQPVMVERAMWWPGPTWTTWYEAHNSPGTTETGIEWALAEGWSGEDPHVETYILIANTSAYAGQVKVTLLFEEGTPATAEATFTLLPNSRRTLYPPLDFAAALPAGTSRRYGAIIESVGATPAQIVVERAMYGNDSAGVVWAAGTNAVGTRLR